MKPVLYFLTIVLGLSQIGIAFGLSSSVDQAMNARQQRPLNVQGPQENMVSGEVTTSTARRLTMLAAAVGICGGSCMMIGTVLMATHMLQTHSSKSRLGSDVKPDA